MDTQWGISINTTSANGLIWAVQSLTEIAVPRTAWNFSWNKCPVTTSLTRTTSPSSPHSTKQGGEALSKGLGSIYPGKLWRPGIRATKSAFPLMCILLPMACRGASHAKWGPWLLYSLEITVKHFLGIWSRSDLTEWQDKRKARASCIGINISSKVKTVLARVKLLAKQSLERFMNSKNHILKEETICTVYFNL